MREAASPSRTTTMAQDILEGPDVNVALKLRIYRSPTRVAGKAMSSMVVSVWVVPMLCETEISCLSIGRADLENLRRLDILRTSRKVVGIFVFIVVNLTSGLIPGKHVVFSQSDAMIFRIVVVRR